MDSSVSYVYLMTLHIVLMQIQIPYAVAFTVLVS